MYLRETRQKRADGSMLTHLQLAESVWDPIKRQSKIRVVFNCGRADDPAVAERLRRCAPEEIVAEQPDWRLIDAWPYGDVHILEQLWQRLGIAEVITKTLGRRKFGFPLERALFAMVATESGQLI
ncbi:MAG: hypothetical protein J5I81_11745 [Nitrococcus mobilis]|nr:hypothetical protein [Nitrococcus mobilis]